MKDKTWGNILFLLGITIIIFSAIIKVFFDHFTDHITSYMSYTFIWFIAAIISVFGFLLRRSDELDNYLKASQLKINKDFKDAKERERNREEFKIFLDDFDKEEKEVVLYLHTYEGVKLDVLKENVSLSKKKLDDVLKKLQKNKVIEIMPEDKIYLLKLSK